MHRCHQWMIFVSIFRVLREDQTNETTTASERNPAAGTIQSLVTRKDCLSAEIDPQQANGYSLPDMGNSRKWYTATGTNVYLFWINNENI